MPPGKIPARPNSPTAVQVPTRRRRRTKQTASAADKAVSALQLDATGLTETHDPQAMTPTADVARARRYTEQLTIPREYTAESNHRRKETVEARTTSAKQALPGL